MSSKHRYLIGAKSATGLTLPLAETAAGQKVPSDAVRRSLKSGYVVAELAQQEAGQLAHLAAADLDVEEDQDLEMLMSMPGLGVLVSDGGGKSIDFKIVDAETNKPVSGVTLFGQGANATYRAESGKDGRGVLRVFESPLEYVIASPEANYWSRVLEKPDADEEIEIALRPLKSEGKSAWPLSLLGCAAPAIPFTGSGIKIGLIDSGVAAHPDLADRDGFNALAEGAADAFRSDENGHGTHSAGIIAGRGDESGISGVAPEAEVYPVKVYPDGRLSDLIEAIQWCIDQRMDIIHFGVGFPLPSAILATKLSEAVERGITCISGAGNQAGPSLYPSAYEGVIGVSAIGHAHFFPADSSHILRLSELMNEDSGLFLANFSNQVTGASFCAPGVAIISSVPAGYAAWDGTSSAAAFVTGLAALVLQAYPELRTGDYHQCVAVRQYLEASAADLDLPAEFQGAGLPNAEQTLSEASLRQAAARRVTQAQAEAAKNLKSLHVSIRDQRKEIQALMSDLR